MIAPPVVSNANEFTGKKAQHSGSRGRKIHIQTNDVSWILPSSLQGHQEWSAVPDKATGYYYFYHKGTRETTWGKPDTFNEWQAIRCISGDVSYYNVLTRTISQFNRLDTILNGHQEWRAVPDKATGYYYFYHKGTRETTWRKPDMFNEWQAIRCISGDVSYYNVLTRTISHFNHLDTILNGHQEWKAVPDKVTGYYYFYHKGTRETTWRKPDMFNEWEPIRCISGEVYYYNVLTRMISNTNPMDIMNKRSTEEGRMKSRLNERQTQKLERKRKKEAVSTEDRLVQSLQKYFPEVFDNELVLRKLKGKERQVIQAIQSVTTRHCCPFDEVRESIASVLKLTIGIVEVQENSFDEEGKLEEKIQTSSTLVPTILQRTNVPVIYMTGRNNLTIQYV